MLATPSVTDPTTIDSVIRFVMRSPHVSAFIGGKGLGNLLYHLPRFGKQKAQTKGLTRGIKLTVNKAVGATAW